MGGGILFFYWHLRIKVPSFPLLDLGCVGHFRFNHPMEVKKNRKHNGSASTEAKDFEFAKQELLQVQEAK